MTSHFAKRNMDVDSGQCRFLFSKLVLSLILGLSSAFLYGQKVFILQDSIPIHQFDFKDSSNYTIQINDFLRNEISKGYVFASIDSSDVHGDTLDLYFHAGDQYKWGKTQLVNPPVRERKNEGVFEIINRSVSYYAENGYPFAQVFFDSIAISGEEVNGRIRFDPGPLIVYDTISTNSKNLKPLFLHRTLDIGLAKTYKESDFESIDRKIKRIPFAKLESEPQIGFAAGKANVYLDIKDENASRIEGILGVLPSQGQTQTQVTGYLNLDLLNLFRSGKKLQLRWNRFSQDAQRLSIKYEHTYLLSSDLSVDFSFDLLRQDSTFTKRDFEIGASYNFGIRSKIKFSFKQISSDLISSEPSVSDGLDFERDEYSILYSFGDESLLKRKTDGIRFQLGFGVGEKKIEQNALLPVEVYDTIDLRTISINLGGIFESQQRLNQNLYLNNQMEFANLMNRETLRNELYRIGGLRSLRGFDENFFFVQYYAISRNEFRFFFSDRSYLVGFADVSFFGSDIDNLDFNNIGNAYGGGLSIDTDNGIFEFIFAIGADRNQTFNFQNTKVHFGYTITF